MIRPWMSRSTIRAFDWTGAAGGCSSMNFGSGPRDSNRQPGGRSPIGRTSSQRQAEIGRVLKPGGVACVATEYILEGGRHGEYFTPEEVDVWLIAPSGLAFYTGNMFPEWKNSVFVGALGGQMLDRLRLDGKKVVGEEPLLMDRRTRIRDVRMGPEGAVYVLTDGGTLLKLTQK